MNRAVDQYVVATAAERSGLGISAERLTTIEQAWTTPEVDLVLHDRWFALKQERQRTFAAGRCADLMTALEVEYSDAEIGLRRLGWALDRGLASGARTLATTAGVMRIPGAGELVRRRATASGIEILPAPVPERGRTALRAVLSRLWTAVAGRAAARTARSVGTGALVVVADAPAGSPYARAARIVLGEAKRRGTRCLVLTSSWRTTMALGREGFAAAPIAFDARGESEPSSGESIDRFRRLASHLAATRAEDEEVAALDWLAAPARVADLMTANAARSALRKLFERVRPSAVFLMPHWNRLASLATLEARIRHCTVASAPVLTVSGHHASIMGWESLDFIAAYGAQCVRAFGALGFAPERLPVVGNLGFDRRETNTALARRRIEATLGAPLPDGKGVVLVATSGLHPDEAPLLAALGAICRRRGNLVIVEKAHPALSGGAPPKTTAAGPLRLAGGAIEDAILAADVVLTDASTVGAQAVVLGRPLVVVNLTGAPFRVNDYASMGVAVGVERLADLEAALDRAIGSRRDDDDPALAAFLRDYNGPNDGRAAARLLDRLGLPAGGAG